jgi:hypothetical protein
MSKIPTMVATVHANEQRREVAVVVEHEDWQSFSRAVEPRARKEFKRWAYEHVMFGQLAQVGASLGWHTVREQPRRCISVIRFTY